MHFDYFTAVHAQLLDSVEVMLVSLEHKDLNSYAQKADASIGITNSSLSLAFDPSFCSVPSRHENMKVT